MNEFFLFLLRMDKTTGMRLHIKSLVSQLPGRVRDETLDLAPSINKYQTKNAVWLQFVAAVGESRWLSFQ